MTTDLYGLPITVTNPATVQGINDFIHGFIAYEQKAPNIIAAADADPDCALANAYAAMLWMFLEAPAAPAKAAPYLARARSADPGSEREALVVDAIGH